MPEPLVNMTSNDRQSDSGDWHAVYTRHQHETSVMNRLAERGMETFLPMYIAVHRWKDRNKQISRPLFPCYVFLRFEPQQHSQVITTSGVIFMLTMAGRPAPIPNMQIDAIRRTVASHLQVEPHPFLRCGDWVRVKSGPLCDVEGILVRRKGSYRLVLSAELLEKSVAVEVDALSVEPIQRRTEINAPRSIKLPAMSSHAISLDRSAL
jgi:transcription termination/antitermination protein NusG